MCRMISTRCGSTSAWSIPAPILKLPMKTWRRLRCANSTTCVASCDCAPVSAYLISVAAGGGLVIHAAQHYGVDVLGITLKPKTRADLANQRIAQAGLQKTLAGWNCADYRDLNEIGGFFDKLVSVGHVSSMSAKSGSHFTFNTPGNCSALAESSSTTEIALRANEAVAQGARLFLSRLRLSGRPILIPINATLRYAGRRPAFEVRDVESLREHYATDFTPLGGAVWSFIRGASTTSRGRIELSHMAPVFCTDQPMDLQREP